MNSTIINGLKAIAEAWKGILAIAGIITVVAVTAVKIDHWKTKNINVDSSISKINDAVSVQDIKIDSILLKLEILKEIKKDIKGLKTGQTNLVNSLADHMSKDKSVTKDDLINFMRQFQLEQEKKNIDYNQTQQNMNTTSEWKN